MAVYNCETFLSTAIESILSQSFSDFEFIIINDGSTDISGEIIARYRDPRIRTIENSENIGLTKSLNKGLAVARGDYIARMDADDISLRKRFAEQVGYLERNPDVHIVGSWFDEVDLNGKRLKTQKAKINSILIRWRLLFGNAFGHSTVMFRRKKFDKQYYDESVPYGQDYDLWSRLCWQEDSTNIPKVLVKWRVNSHSISSQKKDKQKSISESISRKNLESIWGGPISDEEFVNFRVFAGLSQSNLTVEYFCKIIQRVEKLKEKFLRKFAYRSESDASRLGYEIANQAINFINKNTFGISQKTRLYRQWYLSFRPNLFKLAAIYIRKHYFLTLFNSST